MMIDDEKDPHSIETPRIRTDWLGRWHHSDEDDDGIGKQQVGTQPPHDPDPDFCPPIEETCVTPNGIDAMTGDYLTPPISDAEFAALVKPGPLTEAERKILRRVLASEEARKNRRALKPGVKARDLTQTGWGVIYPRFQAHHHHIRTALEPLLTWRRSMTRYQDKEIFEEYRGVRGYNDESALAFMSRNGGNAAFVDPDRMPYYLLIVGSPEEIPVAFQYQLATRHAVGRIYFEDIADYRRYAESVVAAERELARRDPRWWTRKKPRRQRGVAFWNPWHPDDSATRRSRTELVEPLFEACQEHRKEKEIRLVEGEDASRESLLELFNDRPALLFTASHGVGFAAEDSRQADLQGALLGSAWAGPNSGPLRREQYLAASDVPEATSLSGTILFHFACFSAGTPRRSDFAFRAREDESDADAELRKELRERLGLEKDLAPNPFLSALPRRLLSLPEKGGALAAVGHVDRTWTTAFSYLGEGYESIAFASVLEALLNGAPLGHAMQYMSMHYAQLSSDVADVEHRANPAANIDAATSSLMWRAMTDARNFMVLGDPAVRLLG